MSVVLLGSGNHEFATDLTRSGVQLQSVLPESAFPEVGSGKGATAIASAIGALPTVLRMRQKVATTVAALNPDVMCCYDFRSAWLVGTSRRLSSCPLVVHLHGFYTFDMLPRYCAATCQEAGEPDTRRVTSHRDRALITRT